jgi:hypothetical protein
MAGEWVLAVLLSINPGGDVPHPSGHRLAEYPDKETCDHFRAQWYGLKLRDEAVWDKAKQG